MGGAIAGEMRASISDRECLQLEGHPGVAGMPVTEAVTLGWFRTPRTGDGKGRDVVAVLAIGAKTSGSGSSPPAAFELVHEIFGELVVGGTLKREPCCAEGRPMIAESELEDAMSLLRRLLRRRRR
jgi:hypothetical protein